MGCVMTTATDHELCTDPQCVDESHLPDRDDDWDDASWVEFDHRAQRREATR